MEVKYAHPLLTKKNLFIAYSPSGQPDTVSACCTVGLPVTTVLLPVVGSLATALIMWYAQKKRRRRARRGAHKEVRKGLEGARPAYEFPRSLERSIELKGNTCYEPQYD